MRSRATSSNVQVRRAAAAAARQIASRTPADGVSQETGQDVQRRDAPSSLPSSRWQVFRLREVGNRGFGVAEMDLDRPVPGQVLVGSDGVVLDPVVLDLGGQVDRVGDLFEEQPLVLQGAEAAFA